MKKISTRALAIILSFLMLLSVLPITAVAEEVYKSTTHTDFKTIESNLAPGVTQSIHYAYSSDGKQMVYYLATADIARDDVYVQSSYKDAQCTTFGMDKLSAQMAAADAKYSNPNNAEFMNQYYTAVAGVNGDFYNMTTGQPTGAFAMNGVVSSVKANDRPFFAVMADGVAICGKNNIDWDAAVEAHGDVQQAVGGSQMLVNGGVDVTANASGSYNTERHSRTMVGVTATGKVVIAVLDGRQEPFSCGGTMHELAQIMLQAGCVSAINLDGGGSTTFAARQEGADEVTIVNRPSDGSERSISSGIIIASTAVPSNTFDHATLTPANDYVTPNSEVAISAVGVSAAGTSATIPSDVTYSATLGTVDSNGVFTSDGTTGEAEVSMLRNNVVVGTTTINVVIPEELAFSQSEITIPYGNTVDVTFRATYGLNEVAIKESDITFSVENEAAATIDGFSITACEDESITETGISATLTQGEGIDASATLLFGRGSEVVTDFENFSIPDSWNIVTGYPDYGPKGATNGQNEKGSIEIVDESTGKVHNGNDALAINVDMSQLYETGYHLLNFTFGADSFKIPANATAFGFWMYVPEDTEALYSRCLVDTDGNGKGDYMPEHLPTGLAATYLEPGWHYYNLDMRKYTEHDADFFCMQIYINDRDNSTYNYYFKNQYSVDSKFTLYMDDITVDYSTVVDDREPPIFTSVRYADGSMSDATELNGQIVTDDVISFGAVVHEDTSKNNYTGLNASTAKAYIDGVKNFCTYSGGTISIQDAVLADGVHTVAFEITDKMGNTAKVSRKITVAANSTRTYVNLTPQTPEATKIPIGSVQWYDLRTNAIQNVKSLTTVLNLNSVSVWELEGMTVAPGFSASYTVDAVTNDATITITRTGDAASVGESILASIPVRTWVSTITNDAGYEASTPESLWKRKIIWPKDIKISADYGLVTLTDGSTTTFSSERYQTITELYGNYAALNANGDYSNKSSWHVHTTEALEDKEPTCTNPGYTGRSYCAECNSVVDWGTTIPATGHNYDFVDGVLQCTACGEKFNGVYTDGKEYDNGVSAEDGWHDELYYVGGQKVTGVYAVEGVYYDFCTDGKCKGEYTGLFLDSVTGMYRYAQLGKLSSGWKQIDDEWYYFCQGTNAAPKTEYKYWSGTPYEFEETGKLVSGVWVTTEEGTRYYYGPDYYHASLGRISYANVIWETINGEKYGFDANGYRYENVCAILESNQKSYRVTEFSPNGSYIGGYSGDYTGLISAGNGQQCYIVNGQPDYAGMIEIDNDFYYVRSLGIVANSGTYRVYKTNGIVPDGSMITVAADGKVNISDTFKDGFNKIDGVSYYYKDGSRYYAGLIEVDGYYYYVRSNGAMATNGTYRVYKTNGLVPDGSSVTVGKDGKTDISGMFVDGFNKVNGATYYYKDGARYYAGLIEVDGDYYYVRSNGIIATSGTYQIYKTNGYVPDGAKVTVDAKGKADISGKFVDGFNKLGGVKYYYKDGEKYYAGLIEVDGDYYYVRSSGIVATNGTYFVWKTNGLISSPQEMTFDRDGKAVQ